MHFDDVTWQCLKKVSSSIEGLVCSMIIYLEDTGIDAEMYHYEVFNKLWNEFRELEIDAVENIRQQFLEIKKTIEDMAEKMRNSDTLMQNLREKLDDVECMYDRLVMHSHNIKRFTSDTENPYIPDEDDEIYSVFSDYMKCIDEYRMDTVKDSDDVVSELLISFYESVVSTFESLFDQYNKLLSDVKCEIHQRKTIESHEKQRKIEEKLRKITATVNITKSAAELAYTVGAVMIGVPKKTPVDVAKKAINLCAVVKESLDDVNPNRRSIAREAIKRMGLENLLKKAKSSIAVETIYRIYSMNETAMDFVETFRSGKKVRASLKVAADMTDTAIGMYKSIILKLYEKGGDKICDKSCSLIRRQAKEIKDYERAIFNYRVEKKKNNRFPRKLKRPPLVPLNVAETGSGIISYLVEKGIDIYGLCFG